MEVSAARANRDQLHVSENPFKLLLPVNTEDNFVGGKLSQYLREWAKLTNDPWVLDQISGVQVQFINLTSPPTNFYLREYQFRVSERKGLETAVKDLEKNDIIHRVHNVEGQYLSNIMGRLKRDGSVRCILN